MKIVIINGSARKGNTLTAINAFIKGASEKNEIEIIEPDKLNKHVGFDAGDSFVKDTWTDYVSDGNAVLAKPEDYMTLR